MTLVPVLDVGGSHVAAAWVDVEDWSFSGDVHEVGVVASGSASQIVTGIARSAQTLGDLGTARLGVAIPGPFDYAAGIGRFVGVGKFEALNGADVGRLLAARLARSSGGITFINDAAAFGLGEWVVGAASRYRRAVAITLGTGVGSAFIADGTVITDGADVPPQGSVHLLRPKGQPLESKMSTRAIVHAYGRGSRGVVDVVADTQRGDLRAREVLDDAFGFLGLALAPWVAAFGAEVLVVGGRVALSWSVIGPLLTEGLVRGGVQVPIVPAASPTRSGLVGVAYHLARQALI